jgi:hypothetical protein
MYQFTTTTIINSANLLDYNGNELKDSAGSSIARFYGTSTYLDVRKVHKFLKSNIVSISKRPYTVGVKEVASIVIAAGTSGAVNRLTIELGLAGSVQSEFTNYAVDFKKPIVVEIISAGVAATDATEFKSQLDKLKNRLGQPYFTVALNTATLTFTAKEDSYRFNLIAQDELTAASNSITQYTLTRKATGTVGTAGALGFGDNAWMTKSVMLQSLDNARPFGINKEERPELNGNYTQYTIRYSVAKQDDGIVAGGNSITTHVLWVKGTLVATVDAAIAAVGLTVPVSLTATASDGGGLAVGTPKYVNTTTNATDQIVWSGAVGATTFTSSDTGKATVSTAGLVTPTTNTGAFTITVTDSVGNTDTVYYSAYATLAATAANGAGTTLATAVSLDTSDNATDQIAVTGGAGTITYASNEPTLASVSATGEVSTAALTGTGGVIITVTDVIGNVDYVYYTVVA